MKIHPCEEMFSIYNKPIVMAPDQKEAATLAQVCIEALLHSMPGDNIPSERKMHRYNLARRLKKAHDSRAEELDLPVEDLALIKECVSKAHTIGVMGAIFTSIESSDSRA